VIDAPSAEFGSEIFDQRSTECDVGDLQAAAQTQGRDRAGAQPAEQCKLECVAVGIRHVDGREPPAPVASRIDIDSPADDHPVDPIDGRRHS